MTKTAVEWVQKKLWQNNILTSEELELFEQANEMFEQQIIEAYNKGCNEIHSYYEFIKDKNITQTKEPFSAEQYYNETFNK